MVCLDSQHFLLAESEPKLPSSSTLVYLPKNSYVLNHYGKRLNVSLLESLHFSIVEGKHFMHISDFCKVLKLARS